MTMTLDAGGQINQAFARMLEKYERGISNTSTVKYDEIRTLLGQLMDLSPEEIYVTGAATRMSNLDTRFPQGNNKNQHLPLGVAFFRDADEKSADSLRGSARSTIEKFVNGLERGTQFDSVILFLQRGDEERAEPLLAISAENSPLAGRIAEVFPEIEQDLVKPAETSHVGEGVPQGAQPPRPQGTDLFSLVESFHSALIEVGLTYERTVVGRLIASLLAKKFLILSGTSGTGKSRIGQALALWLARGPGEPVANHKVVPVGSDWTNRDPLLGYADALDPTQYQMPPSGVLQLILAAIEDGVYPYFLVLDEMNLAHVERYFADLLSAMETRQAISLFDGNHERFAGGVPVESEFELPSNFFVIGTVNVDETTYMFSPKVLDRASVLEFGISKSDVDRYLDSFGNVRMEGLAGAGSSYAELFVTASNLEVGDLGDLVDSRGKNLKQETATVLNALFEGLTLVGAGFGYRSIREIARFAYFYSLVEGSRWTCRSALDAGILQKVLPKLHGSRTKLGPVLQQMLAILDADNYPLSVEKLERMSLRLKQNGFTSFADP